MMMSERFFKAVAGAVAAGALLSSMAACTGSDSDESTAEAKTKTKDATTAVSAPAKSVKLTATEQKVVMGAKGNGQVTFKLKNESKESLTLAGAVVSGFGGTAFGAAGTGSVTPIPDGVTIGAGESLAIDGKKYGLKIMQPYVTYKKGDSVHVTLRFKTNNTATFEVKVDKEIKKVA